MTEIVTARLRLRRWLPDDRAPFAAMHSDPAVVDPFTGPKSRQQSDDLIADFETRWQSDGFCFAAAERKADGAFLGMVGIARCGMDAPFCPCVEIGWHLDRAHWGNGYATEAARGWLVHGFEVHDLQEIVAFTEVDHAPSIAVMRRAGMMHDPSRDFDHPDLPEGHPARRHVLYSARRDLWRAV